MSDQSGTPADTGAQNGADPQQPAPPVIIHAQYVKDLSFEAPNAPEIFQELGDNPPSDIPITVDMRARQMNEQAFEVQLQVTAQAKNSDKTAFMCELLYAAVVSLNVPEEHVQPALLVEVPRLLFPYARKIVADCTQDGGFPPLLLQPVDFMQIYQQKMSQAAAQEAEKTDPEKAS